MKKEYSEYESETSYTYEDEDEESESLQERPKLQRQLWRISPKAFHQLQGLKRQQ